MLQWPTMIVKIHCPHSTTVAVDWY